MKKSKKKNSNIYTNISGGLILIFSILFFLFPLSYGLLKLKYILIILILIYVILKISISKKSFKNIKLTAKTYPIILFAITLISRIIISFLLHNRVSQISDFGQAFNAMKSLDFSGLYYQNFVHWIFYPLIYNVILKNFAINQLTILILNSIVLSFVSVLIYHLANIILKNTRFAFLAAMLYIMWPANTLYVAIMTPEHVAQLFLLSGVILILKTVVNFENKNIFKFFSYTILSGILLGISAFFKDFAPVVLIALFIYFIFQILKNINSKKAMLKFLIVFVNLIIVFIFTNSGMYLIADKVTGTTVNRNIAPCYLLVGLHSSGNGTYNADLYDAYFNILADSKDYKVTNAKIKEMLVNDIKANKNILQHLNYKYKRLMINDSERISWIIESMNQNGNFKLASFLRTYINPINNAYYLLILILMFFGLFKINLDKNLEVLLLYIIIFGASFLIILIEVQGRYLYTLFPFFCIIASYGLIFYKKIIESKKSKCLEVEK